MKRHKNHKDTKIFCARRCGSYLYRMCMFHMDATEENGERSDSSITHTISGLVLQRGIVSFSN